MNIRFLRERKLTTLIAALVVIVVIVIIALYIYGKKAETPALTGFAINTDHNFNAYGKNLSSVEIWEEPTGTNVEPRDDQLLEKMNVANNDPNNQIWVATRPTEPILASKIYAKGLDNNGNEVGRIELPYIGATQIYNALWGTTTAQ